MTLIRKSYLLSHDIDWIFRHQDKIIHCATNGYIIPDKYADNKIVYPIQEIVHYMPEILSNVEIEVNEEYVERFIANQSQMLREMGFEIPLTPTQLRDVHLSTFVNMAKKGIWSYDHPSGCSENEFIWVAKPKNVDITKIIMSSHPITNERLENLFQIEPNISFNNTTIEIL